MQNFTQSGLNWLIRNVNYVSECNSHITKARAAFVSGNRDVYDDAEWEKYLKELDQLNYQRCVLDIAQASYERTLAGLN